MYCKCHKNLRCLHFCSSTLVSVMMSVSRSSISQDSRWFKAYTAKDFTSSTYYRSIPNVRYIVICQPLGLKKRYPFLTENVKIVKKVLWFSQLFAGFADCCKYILRSSTCKKSPSDDTPCVLGYIIDKCLRDETKAKARSKT